MSRRSVCPVACSLDLVGDRWTMLVLRDAMLGATRFGEFAAAPEKIPTNILSERLERLVASGLLEKQPVSEGAVREGYFLTEKGRALKPVLTALKDWGLAHLEGTRLLRSPKA